MQIVIDIPEEEFERCKKRFQMRINIMSNAIANGIPLPKGHGRLIDADKLPLDNIDDANYGSNYIRIAPTVIEADKGDE